MMTPDTVGPLTRLIDVRHLPPHGLAQRLEATPEECKALAEDFKLSAIRSLVGDYTIAKTGKGVRVTGRITADMTQICVVSLDPFDSILEEDVEIDFADTDTRQPEHAVEVSEYDPPDEIVNGRIDIGALTAEFLALGLDPYPKKPGVSFDEKYAHEGEESPFAALGKLKKGE
ncbi:YceD family protein [Microvirga flavescens]|uniref:YceD family protein n=1 Tax=Microvirga flavescens TaxID=2249811 RepID=UPI001FE18669|nr:DUF177 domain-containing protein [Microvirga flavescens]